MVSPRISKALNPHRKLSLKQIRAGFGGKRRQASLKVKRHAHKPRRAAAASNPKKKRKRATAKAKNATRTKVVYRTKYKTRTKKVYVASPKPKRKANAKRKRTSRSKNPPYLMTLKPLGFGNPQKKRRKSVAKTRRKARAKGSSGKRRNPTRRRAVAKRGRGPARHRSRNPMDSSLLKKGFGVFVGFSAIKKGTPLLGASMNSSPTMSLLSAAIVAGVLSWGTKKFVPGPVAEGVMWGAIGGVVNQAWNSFAPAAVTGVWPGVGDFAPATQPWLLPRGPVGFISDGGGMPVADGAQVNMGAWAPAW